MKNLKSKISCQAPFNKSNTVYNEKFFLRNLRVWVSFRSEESALYMWDVFIFFFISFIVREVFHLSEGGGTFYNLLVVDNSHLFSIIFVRGNENHKNKGGWVDLFTNFF
jgi:hypothetical protein